MLMSIKVKLNPADLADFEMIIHIQYVENSALSDALFKVINHCIFRNLKTFLYGEEHGMYLPMDI